MMNTFMEIGILIIGFVLLIAKFMKNVATRSLNLT